MAASSAPSAAPLKAESLFGRFRLLRTLGQSSRSLMWLAADPRDGRTLVLAMPRHRPADAQGLQHWQAAARHVARIKHPGLAAVLELGEHAGWPYLVHDFGQAITLAEWIGRQTVPVAELMPLLLQALQALAFAHEAGIAHNDLQPGMFLLTEGTGCRLMGLGVAQPAQEPSPGLQDQRQAAERDVLAFGLVLHHALGGQPALGLPDIAVAIDRMPPLGRDSVRLPWSGANPISDALRAIVNRATERQPRQRYRSARTLECALDGWLRTEAAPGGGPIPLLLERMRAAGFLPAMPGGAKLATRVANLERESVGELAGIVMQDLGLSFELLRSANSPVLRGALGAGSGAILTLRRAIAMVGLNGLRRAAAALRVWPGPLGEAHADGLAQLIDRVQQAGRAAQCLRSPGYDAELVALLAMLQNLGRLALQYHFPEEAAQIRQLMLAAPSLVAAEPEEPGMSEQGACLAVLGVDIDALGTAVGRLWGFDDEVLLMLRRLPQSAPVHAGGADQDLLRLTASCANELVDAWSMPAHRRAAGLQQLAQRYGRALGLDLQDLLSAARGLTSEDAVPAASAVAMRSMSKAILTPPHAPADASALAAPALHRQVLR